MKIVQGFLIGLLLVGVLAPVLSVAGEITPSSGDFTPLARPAGTLSGVALLDVRGGGLLTSVSFFSEPGAGAGAGADAGTGDVAPLAASFDAASRSALSCCLRSFFRSRFARSRSVLSAALALGAPFVRNSLGVSRPEDTFE